MSTTRLSSSLKPRRKRCKYCKGSGRDPKGEFQCPVCNGWGAAPPDPDSAVLSIGTPCRACGVKSTAEDPVITDEQIHRRHAIEQQERYRANLALFGMKP